MNGFDADGTRQTRSRSDVRCRRSFYYGRRTAVPLLSPGVPPPSGALWIVQTCCAPGPTYILKVGDMPGAGDRVPVQSGTPVQVPTAPVTAKIAVPPMFTGPNVLSVVPSPLKRRPCITATGTKFPLRFSYASKVH